MYISNEGIVLPSDRFQIMPEVLVVKRGKYEQEADVLAQVGATGYQSSSSRDHIGELNSRLEDESSRKFGHCNLTSERM